MPTTLNATFQAGTAGAPARVLLSVTGAPTIPLIYGSNFTVSTDGWSGTTVDWDVHPGSGASVLELHATGASGVIVTYSRTITGLTIGQTYRFAVDAFALTSGALAIGVSGIGNTAYVSPPRYGNYQAISDTAMLSYSFTATATSHVIQAKVKLGGFGASTMALTAARVERTSGWLGTTIRRTDVNGTDVVVREAPLGQDTTGTTGSGVMAVTDYEAALVGPVDYTVTDGTGGTATASVAAQAAPGVWLTLPATSNPATPVAPSFVPVELVTDYSESAKSNGTVHEIIGRADPVANPGPLALRSGTLALWCSDYATALKVRALLEGGDIAHLRQPTYPGLDLYLYATDVSLIPEEPSDTQRWIASVSYQEVAAP